MSHESTRAPDVPAPTDGADRYAAFEAGDGSVVLYDRDCPTAWIQSDFAVDVGGN